MKAHFISQPGWLETDRQMIRYRLYRNKYQENNRRLLLLHGAGVAGKDTWEHIVMHLHSWHEVLVPDLRGMGETTELDGVERPFTVEEVVEDQRQLLDHLGWWVFDLGGYSFGGLVGLLLKSTCGARVHKQFFLESALLDRHSMADVIELRDRYSEAAVMLKTGVDIEQGVRLFMDTISPNRIPSPKAEQTTVERLSSRALGFANALDCVSEAARRLERAPLLAVQGNVSSFAGGRSVEALHEYQRYLAATVDNWCYESVRGCDHSLPFQKPRQIAKAMDAAMANYLQGL